MSKLPTINIGHSMDVGFYRDYDPDFLFNKAQTLRLITSNLDEFKKFLVNTVGTAEGIDQKYVEALNAEIHFTEFHQFECFFALLLAVFQDKPHWIYLNEYPPGEIRRRARHFFMRDISDLTNGNVTTMDDFLLWSIYAGYGFPKESAAHEKWIENFRGIEWMLNRLASKYVDGVEYNAYKHGLRLLTGPSYFGFYPDNQPEKVLGWKSDDSVRFLEIQKEQNGKRIQQTVKHFDPEEGVTHLAFMNLALGIIKTCRIARLKGEKQIDESLMINMNKDAIQKLGRGGFKVGLPVELT